VTLHSLVDALADTQALVDIAKRAGITIAQARVVCAALGAMDAQQVVRMCATANADRIRQVNRGSRS
jgi:hypothetical protein